MKCDLLVGYFLARPCGEPASGNCVRCGKGLCVVHTAPVADPAGPVCITCAAVAGAQDWFAPAPDSSRLRRAGSDRAGSDRAGTDTDDLTQFSDDDIAAFDEVSDVDRRRGRNVFDS